MQFHVLIQLWWINEWIIHLVGLFLRETVVRGSEWFLSQNLDLQLRLGIDGTFWLFEVIRGIHTDWRSLTCKLGPINLWLYFFNRLGKALGSLLNFRDFECWTQFDLTGARSGQLPTFAFWMGHQLLKMLLGRLFCLLNPGENRFLVN